MLPADPIQDFNEASLEARECRRAYKPIVASLLEQHHWNLATKRASLAVVTNDRSDEWPYAYAKPTDMAYPVALLPDTGAGYSGWFMRDYYYFLPTGRRLFMQAKGVIYSTLEAARLEYTSFEITEGEFTSRFRDIVVLAMAARICHPITKNGKRAQELFSQFEFERQRAIAADLNRNQPTYGDKPTESELVRGMGIDLNYVGSGFALDPVANPSNTGL